ncbi:MAG: enoyl-CoA hydratase/isomerase family protein [Pseudomonadales bacterium]
MTAPVLFEELTADNGKRIGIITLSAEKTLNALTLEMVNLMLQQLGQWQHDNNIACVLVKGAGVRAFCAGGDVQCLHQSAVERPGGPCHYAEDFFTREYRLDYLFHTYPKPVICWGHGIVMGGGVGVMAACSHRVATEKTRIAMPEITIALYPDVGGSWFLNRMPGKSGVFLALTGAAINGADSLFTDLADYFLSQDQYESVVNALLIQPWSTLYQHNHDIVSELLTVVSANSSDALPEGRVESHLETINQLCDGDDVVAIINAIIDIETEDQWLAKASANLMTGSPLSGLIIYHQLQVSRKMTLAQVFRSEIQLSTNIVRYPEFAEGVRALLIDKDRNPLWQFKTVEEVPADLLSRFFVAPTLGSTWPANPLADL